MGQDYLFSDCVRAPAKDVRNAVVRLLAREGWKVSAKEPRHDAKTRVRRLELVSHGDWSVLVESGETSPVEWGERLAAALDCSALTIRAWSDLGVFEVHRYDGAKHVGSIAYEYDANRRKAAVVAAPLLADLAPARSRSLLRKGISFRPIESDAALERIVKLAALPPLLDRYVDPGGTVLFFSRRAPPAKPNTIEAPPLPTARDFAKLPEKRFKTMLLDTVHAPGVARERLMEAAARVISQYGLFRCETAQHRVERDVVFVSDGSASACGEVIREWSPFSPKIPWGNALSQVLRRPVLAVRATEDALLLRAWVDGVGAETIELTPERRVSFDPTPLMRALGAKKKLPREVRLSFPRTPDVLQLARAVGKTLRVTSPIVEGSVTGVVVPFGPVLVR